MKAQHEKRKDLLQCVICSFCPHLCVCSHTCAVEHLGTHTCVDANTVELNKQNWERQGLKTKSAAAEQKTNQKKEEKKIAIKTPAAGTHCD